MIDYTQFGASTMPPSLDEEDVRRRRPAVQQPAGTPIQQPQQQPVASPGPQQQQPSGYTPAAQPAQSAPSTAAAPTFRQLQVQGIPRPAPPQLPVAQPVAQPNEQRTTDQNGNVSIKGNGVSTYIPAGQVSGFGGYDPNKPPPGYDPRAWQVNQDDLKNRQAHVYVTPDGQTHYGKSEGMGDSFASGDEFSQYLASLPEQQRQIAMFANPKALQMLQSGAGQFTNTQTAIAGAAGGGAAPGLGSPNPVSANPASSGSGLGGSIVDTIRNLLSNPTAYGSDAMMREYAAGARGIDDDFQLQQKRLNEEMARRGLYDSSIAGGNLSDLNIGRRSAQVELMDRLLGKRADAQDQGLRSALSAAMGYDSDVGNRAQRQSEFDRNYGLDERRFTSDEQYRNKQFDANEKARQDALLQAWYQLFGL